MSGPQEDWHHGRLHTGSEEKGALAKLMGAVRTNGNDRYNETGSHWGGNIPGPKSVAHITKLEKEKFR